MAFSLLLSAALTLAAWGLAKDAAPPTLRLRIDPQGWGDAPPDDVRKVLESAGGQLTRYFLGVELPTLAVRPGGGPIVLHEREADGTIQIQLDTQDTYWSQYAFQFGHELCHVLCRYDEDPTGNLWFEESLCELASLFVLRGMSRDWAEHPPYPNWKDYGPRLADYARTRIETARLPAGQPLAQWYGEHAERLSREPTVRELNLVVATALLDEFESQPEHWLAVHWLNSAKPEAPQSFREYLQAWHDNVPEAHRAFVRKLASKFEIELTAD